MMQKYFNQLMPLLIAILCTTGIYAQDQITVSGTVTDSDDVPIPGVNVIQKGSSNGTTTDFDGNMLLNFLEMLCYALVFWAMRLKT